jgi:hypothetical protein
LLFIFALQCKKIFQISIGGGIQTLVGACNAIAVNNIIHRPRQNAGAFYYQDGSLVILIQLERSK